MINDNLEATAQAVFQEQFVSFYGADELHDGYSIVNLDSLCTVKAMLTQYAKEQGFLVVEIYVDDGYSGLNFDRPSFNRMLDDIEAGKIDVVITKDLSRLGRDHLKVGHFTEIYFPMKNVRYIHNTDRLYLFIQASGTAYYPESGKFLHFQQFLYCNFHLLTFLYSDKRKRRNALASRLRFIHYISFLFFVK